MKKFVFLFLLISQNIYSYPTTITKYRTCKTCHLTASGGTILNDYGRGMSEAFMSTWSTEDEAREFFIDDSSSFDWGMDYRHLTLSGGRLGSPVNFPMVLDFDGAIHVNPKLTLVGSIGYYGSERVLESRENYGQLELFKTSTLRFGYFISNLGINTNDHSLAIKRIAGLSRGSETYNIELWNLNDWFQTFYTVSSKEFYIENGDKNFYRIATPDGSQAHRLRFSTVMVPKWEFGFNYLTSDDYKMNGIFVKGSLFKDQYIFYERDVAENETAIYARTGYFIFKGFDFFTEFDTYQNSVSRFTNLYFGFDWMVRPRIELSFKINLGQGEDQGQMHLWL